MNEAEQNIGPFSSYYHKNIAAFTRLLEASPPNTFSPEEIRANHFAAGGVLLNYDLPDVQELLGMIPEPDLDGEENDEFQLGPDPDATGTEPHPAGQ